MPTPHTIGSNCHIMLTHPAINNGDPYGFILQSQDNDLGESFTMQREISGTAQSVRVFFHILLADNLTNPNGTRHEQNRAQMYAVLAQYLAKANELTIATNIGAFANIGATGHTATEQHFPQLSIIAVQLNNTGTYYDPVDINLYQNSTWDGPLTWDTSFWR